MVATTAIAHGWLERFHCIDHRRPVEGPQSPTSQARVAERLHRVANPSPSQARWSVRLDALGHHLQAESVNLCFRVELRERCEKARSARMPGNHHASGTVNPEGCGGGVRSDGSSCRCSRSPGAPSPEALAPFLGQPGLIAFVREGRQAGVYAIDPSGTGLKRLTDGQDYRPRWSPDGTRIVFQRFDGARSDLFVMDADGSNLESLGVQGSQPSWSPDGTRIVFCYGRRYRSNDISVVNADGSGLAQLTDDRVADVLPTWSPDGTTILYTHGDPRPDLWLMDADGTNQKRLTRSPSGDFGGDWSPDGSTIVFYSRRHANWDLYTIRPDGSDLRRLTETRTTEWAPAWSPDGSRIAYTVADTASCGMTSRS